eukprot:171905-Alexandrium_andersonii.AAC.3
MCIRDREGRHPGGLGPRGKASPLHLPARVYPGGLGPGANHSDESTLQQSHNRSSASHDGCH